MERMQKQQNDGETDGETEDNFDDDFVPPHYDLDFGN